MKSFREYLIESKQTYDFKIKLVGDHEKDASDKIKNALSKFNVESISEGKSTPIQETQADFPSHSNVGTTIFDIVLTYPATNLELQSAVAEALNLTHECIKIRSAADEKEEEINHEHDEKTGKSLLGTDYDKENNQNIVGDKQVMSLLKELSKNKHQGEQYKGVNDKILAKKSPSEKSSTISSVKNIGTKSPIGTSNIEKPTAEKLGK